MSHLACTLCGLNSPLSKFDPSKLDLDIQLKSFKGLGKGKGFESLTPAREHYLGDILPQFPPPVPWEIGTGFKNELSTETTSSGKTDADPRGHTRELHVL